jgi:hypothetical protein
MMELRDYQIDIANQIAEKVTLLNICYLAAEVRCGKTLMTLEACKLLNVNKVLFLTKKKAISSIENDYKEMNYSFNLTVINYESLHKVVGYFDLIVLDEHHVNGAFPKPSNRTKLIKQRFSNLPMIFLSGSPAVESGSQWYHQFWVSNYTPFKEINFYKWATNYVNIVKINYGNGYPSNDYTRANRELIQNKIDQYLITFTQKDAGFETVISEQILYCEMKPITYQLAKALLNDRFIKGQTDEILADTPVKLMSKLHQIYNGTCIGESGNVIIIDDSKIQFIKQKFNNKKIAIFYQFKGELDLIKQVYSDDITTDLNEFNNTDKSIAIQQSGSEGMNLSKADFLIYYNFGFSGKNYIQSRDRLTTMSRKSNEVFFIFESAGISEKIYKRIINKKQYNIKQFNQDFNCGKTDR